MCVEQEYLLVFVNRYVLRTLKSNTMGPIYQLINFKKIYIIISVIVGPEDMCIDFKINQNVKLF